MTEQNVKFSMRYAAQTPDELNAVAREMLPVMKEYKIVAFYGEMGAGKTTLIKAICEEMEVEDVVSSPTFALVNEYHTRDNQPVFHFDFYRIEKISELYDLGYEDYFYSGNLCMIEWPEKAPSLIPESALTVRIEVKESGKREISVIAPATER
ncbi:MAG TPA: tRNA (adenosine(37)-N6)-threonylcarbamoyltransferase complex ATPase subunit type 1 TsaE [Bacteroidales bacterium]|nr:tRNA (adenosine(37)-N6)-threonylcarbamoyltransferase complex ATPase subunit type 1 TsaE [Bacteroidales bacterium]